MKDTEKISIVLNYVCTPRYSEVKRLGVAYALDLIMHHSDVPMAQQARSHGVTRAAISNAAREFCLQNGIPPSRWMRSESTVSKCRKSAKATKHHQ